MFLFGAKKNHLIETVLLSTLNICFGWEIRKIISIYTLLSRGLRNHMGLGARKPVFRVCKQKGADQPVHQYSLINASVILLLESIIPTLTCYKGNFIFYLVSVAEQAGLVWLGRKPLKTGFFTARPIMDPTFEQELWIFSEGDTQVKIKRNFQRKIVNMFLPIIFSIFLGCSKEPSHWDGSFEYPQHMFWLRSKKMFFLVRTLNYM